MGRNVVIRRSTATTALLVILTATEVLAQTSTSGVTVTGVAFDSLANRPLRGAIVTVDGSDRSAVTNGDGTFRIEGVAAGERILTALHPTLDSIGISGLTTRVRVSPGMSEVRVAIPSFQTLWTRNCGASAVPSDSAFIFGTVRRVVDEEVAKGARIEVSYFDIRNDPIRGVTQRRGTGEVVATENGAFVLCGLPIDLPIQIYAERDSLSTDMLELAALTNRIRRVDLLIGASEGATGGTLRGVITIRNSSSGAAGARVLTTGASETRSDADGRWVIRDVPLGTRQLTMQMVGASPIPMIVDVRAGENPSLATELDRVTTLTPIEVTAVNERARKILEMEERRERKMGAFVDSLTLARYPSISSALAAKSILGYCALYVDGVKQSPRSDPLALRSPRDIAQIEVHSWSVPVEYRQKRPCPVMLVWTKLGLP